MIIALHNLVWFKVEEALTPFLACAWLVLLADLSSVAPFSSLSALTYTALHCSSSAMLQVAVAWLVYRDVDTLLTYSYSAGSCKGLLQPNANLLASQVWTVEQVSALSGAVSVACSRLGSP